MYGIIYKATNTINDKVYIGQTTKTLAQRKGGHAFQAKKQDRRAAFQIALLDEGFDAFTWEQIGTAESADELDRKEKYWIEFYNSMNPDKGYNLTTGGWHFSASEGTRPRLAKVMGHRREYSRGTVPPGVLYLVAAVDVQRGVKNDSARPERVEIMVMGIGRRCALQSGAAD